MRLLPARLCRAGFLRPCDSAQRPADNGEREAPSGMRRAQSESKPESVSETEAGTVRIDLHINRNGYIAETRIV